MTGTTLVSLAANFVLFPAFLAAVYKCRCRRSKAMINNEANVLTGFTLEPVHQGRIVFAGDSRTTMAPVDTYFSCFARRAFGGWTVEDLLKHYDHITKQRPRLVVVWIGINDVLHRRSASQIVCEVNILTKRLVWDGAEVLLAGIAPVNEHLTINSKGLNAVVAEVNRGLAKLNGEKVHWFDTPAQLIDAEGNLRQEFTLDGLHFNPKGYSVFLGELAKTPFFAKLLPQPYSGN